jgi:hypothetical protein
MSEFREKSLHPRALAMIFYPESDEEDLSPEEIVDRVMDYEPIRL